MLKTIRWRDSVRVILLCLVAVSPSLPTAVSALGRLILYLAALAYILGRIGNRQRPPSAEHGPVHTWVIFSAIAYMALTVVWSSVGTSQGLEVWTRHARILTIPIMVCMIASLGEARMLLRVFIWGQVFVVFSSYLQVFGFAVPWATGAWQGHYAVFSSYLEQCITQAILVGLLWFQRDSVFGKSGRWLAILLAALTAYLTVGLMPGRSGHAVLFALIAFMAVYAIPKKYRWASALIPVLLFMLLQVASPVFGERMRLVVTEVKAHLHGSKEATSSGQRLQYWQKSLEAVAEKPLFGHGAGSWNQEYMRLMGTQQPNIVYSTSDPHNIFLIWAVEGGLLGASLLGAMLLSLWRFSYSLTMAEQQTMQVLVMGIFIAGLFNSVLFGIGLGDFFCIGIGILAAFKGLPNRQAVS